VPGYAGLRVGEIVPSRNYSNLVTVSAVCFPTNLVMKLAAICRGRDLSLSEECRCGFRSLCGVDFFLLV
jgi:hypothetical protein